MDLEKPMVLSRLTRFRVAAAAGRATMAGQRGFFDTDERLRWLSAAGDPLERLASVDFELFRPSSTPRSAGATAPGAGGRPTTRC